MARVGRDPAEEGSRGEGRRREACECVDGVRCGQGCFEQFERCGSIIVKASSSYDKACHLADLGASLRDAVHARDAKKETLDRVAQDAGTGGRRSRRTSRAI